MRFLKEPFIWCFYLDLFLSHLPPETSKLFLLETRSFLKLSLVDNKWIRWKVKYQWGEGFMLRLIIGRPCVFPQGRGKRGCLYSITICQIWLRSQQKKWTDLNRVFGVVPEAERVSSLRGRGVCSFRFLKLKNLRKREKRRCVCGNGCI